MRLFFVYALMYAVGTSGCAAVDAGRGATPAGFWDVPRHGANSFNGAPPDVAYFRALRATGASWVRLTFSKWKGEGRDFLMKDADGYHGLSTSDLTTLRAVLDDAHAAGIKVVIAPLSLPGSRWSQHNGNAYDDRLWQDKAYWTQASAFWHDLVAALNDHPAIAAYNLINEPVPERTVGLAQHSDAATAARWSTHYRAPLTISRRSTSR